MKRAMRLLWSRENPFRSAIIVIAFLLMAGMTAYQIAFIPPSVVYLDKFADIVCDGSTDTASTLQSHLDNDTAAGAEVWFPSKSSLPCMVGTTIYPPPGRHYKGMYDGPESSLTGFSNKGSVIKQMPSANLIAVVAESSWNSTGTANGTPFTWENIQIDGNARAFNVRGHCILATGYRVEILNSTEQDCPDIGILSTDLNKFFAGTGTVSGAVLTDSGSPGWTTAGGGLANNTCGDGNDPCYQLIDYTDTEFDITSNTASALTVSSAVNEIPQLARKTLLTTTINSSTTADLAVISTVGYPPTGFLRLQQYPGDAGAEDLQYTSITDATHFGGITRGVNGTTGAAHTSGVTEVHRAQLPITGPYWIGRQQVAGSQAFVKIKGGRTIKTGSYGFRTRGHGGGTFITDGIIDDVNINSARGFAELRVDNASGWHVTNVHADASSGALSTTLNTGGVADSSTTANIPLVSSTGFPSTGGTVKIQDELIQYNSTSGNNLVGIVRGVDGSLAAAHIATTPVTMSGSRHGFYIRNCEHTDVSGNYVDGFGATNEPVDFYGIYVNCYDGNGLTATNNTIRHNANVGTESDYVGFLLQTNVADTGFSLSSNSYKMTGARNYLIRTVPTFGNIILSVSGEIPDMGMPDSNYYNLLSPIGQTASYTEFRSINNPWDQRTAIPTTGQWQIGQTIKDFDATATGAPGWQVTTAGTAGTSTATGTADGTTVVTSVANITDLHVGDYVTVGTSPTKRVRAISGTTITVSSSASMPTGSSQAIAFVAPVFAPMPILGTNQPTATALAANGGNCSAGNYPLGVDALGAVENCTPGSGITWSEVTGTSQTAAVNSGYVANNASLVTITIPTSCAIGDMVKVVGKGAGLWRVAQNSSEIIHFGVVDTTTGTGGYLQASTSNRYSAVELVCTVANTEWVVSNASGSVDYN